MNTSNTAKEHTTDNSKGNTPENPSVERSRFQRFPYSYEEYPPTTANYYQDGALIKRDLHMSDITAAMEAVSFLLGIPSRKRKSYQVRISSSGSYPIEIDVTGNGRIVISDF